MKTIFKHEDMVLDLTISSKSKLYKNGYLRFLGDGYKAIQIMITEAVDKEAVKQQFHKQIEMRQKTQFTKTDDVESLRQQLINEEEQRAQKNKKGRR